MMRRRLALFAAVLMCVAMAVPLAHGVRLYKWVDKDGHVSYHDFPPASKEGDRVETRDFKIGGVGSTSSAGSSKASEQFPVTLYTAPQCTSCDLARAYLGKRKVPFTDLDVAKDTKLQKELLEKTGTLTVPTIMIGSKVMKGYMESLLAGELDAAGYPKMANAGASTEASGATETGASSESTGSNESGESSESTGSSEEQPGK
jgi:glutaredoxin